MILLNRRKTSAKRGVAIETSLLLLFFLVALSVLLTTVSILSTNLKNKALTDLTQRVEAQTIAEQFTVLCTNPKADLQDLLDGFEQQVNAGGNYWTVTDLDLANNSASLQVYNADDKLVLTVGVALSAGLCTVTEWKQG